MRNTFFVILITALQAFSGNSYAQMTRLSLDVRNSQIKDILSLIENKSEFYFLYNSELVDVYRTVDLTVKNEKIEDILAQLFDRNEVDILIRDKYIVITPADGKMVQESASAKQGGITGKVTDTKGAPLPGVTVAVKGKMQGTVTDANGNYSLSNIQPDAVLVFSFVGMKTQEIPVAGKTSIMVSMIEDAIGIEEVVAIGYGTQKKMNLTGAVVNVKAEELVNQSVTSVAQAIQGRAAGVEVIRNSGAPGAPATIRIRGIGTFGNTEPLVLIDGVEGNINLISSNEIESVNILKDASACAIYGTRAANGVIIITTKKGVSGTSKIQYNVSTGISQSIRVPGILNAKEFAMLQTEALVNANMAAYYTDDKIAGMGEGTNWINEILQTGFRQNHNLLFSGGTDKIRYSLNGDLLDEKGIVINSWYKRYNMRLNLDTDVTRWLTIGLNSFLTHSKIHDNPNSGENTLLTYAAQYTPTITPKTGGMAGTGGPDHNLPTNAEWRTLDPVTYSNLYSGNRNFFPKYTLTSSFFADFKILKGLNLKTTWGINKYFAKNKVFYPSYTYYDSLGENGGAIISERTPSNRYLTIRSYDDFSYTITNVLNYNKSVKDDHNINVLIGNNDQKYKNGSYSATVYNFPTNDLQFLSLGTERQSVSETATHWALRSYFGRLNYDYKGRYLAEFSVRRDASSKFSEKNRWGTFPSGSIGWRISDEKFMGRFSWIDDLKLRTSYGVLGNQELGVVNWNTIEMMNNNFDVASTTSTTGLYESYATMNLTSGYAFNNNNITGAAVSKYANPNIKWEEAHIFNIGLDMALFDGTFVINAEYYNKKTKDLILDVNLPNTAGYYQESTGKSNYYANAGEMKNTGIEYILQYFKRHGDFKFDLRYSGTHNHNEITKLQEGINYYYLDAQYSHLHKVGEPYASLAGYKIIGVYQTQEEINERLKTITERGKVEPGDYIFQDTNGDKVINTNDCVILGQSQPKYIMGLTANVSYKGFDFNIHFQGDLGKQANTRVRGRFNFSYYHYFNNYDYLLNRWHGPGTSNTMSRVVMGSTINGGHSVSTSEAVQSASYVKIRNVECGYTIPPKLTNALRIERIRLYCNVANLAYFTKYVGFEVERTGAYQRTDLYPQCRTISLGANIQL